jgi:hypothetical protein
VRPDAEVTASWSDGTPAVIVRDPPDISMGRTVAVNLFHLPQFVDTNGNFVADWPVDGWLGDGDRAFSSALLWSIRYEKPFATLKNTEIFQDLDCDGFDVSAELSVDLDLALCAARIDRSGEETNRRSEAQRASLSKTHGREDELITRATGR